MNELVSRLDTMSHLQLTYELIERGAALNVDQPFLSDLLQKILDYALSIFFIMLHEV